MNLVAIGGVGYKVVYVDVSRLEAIVKYNDEHPTSVYDPSNDTLQEIEVKDGKFQVYDIWKE